jgi:hypothetical protein
VTVRSPPLTYAQRALLYRAVELGQVVRLPKYKPAQALRERGLLELTATIEAGGQLSAGGTTERRVCRFVPTAAGRELVARWQSKTEAP